MCTARAPRSIGENGKGLQTTKAWFFFSLRSRGHRYCLTLPTGRTPPSSSSLRNSPYPAGFSPGYHQVSPLPAIQSTVSDGWASGARAPSGAVKDIYAWDPVFESRPKTVSRIGRLGFSARPRASVVAPLHAPASTQVPAGAIVGTGPHDAGKVRFIDHADENAVDEISAWDSYASPQNDENDEVDHYSSTTSFNCDTSRAGSANAFSFEAGSAAAAEDGGRKKRTRIASTPLIADRQLSVNVPPGRRTAPIGRWDDMLRGPWEPEEEAGPAQAESTSMAQVSSASARQITMTHMSETRDDEAMGGGGSLSPRNLAAESPSTPEIEAISAPNPNLGAELARPSGSVSADIEGKRRRSTEIT